MTYVAESTSLVDRLALRASRKLLHLRKGVRHRLRNSSRTTRAAFLVGSGRSGTDVVVASLDASLEVRVVNEDNPRAFDNWRLRHLDVVERLVEVSFAPVLLFKPIVETYRIGELLDRFDASRAVFLSRDPADTVNSMVRFFGARTHEVVESWVRSDFRGMTWAVPSEVAASARRLYGDGVSLADAGGIYWFVYSSAFEALDLARDPRVLLVLYEDFVRDPSEEIRRICRHLRVPFVTRMSSGIYSSAVGKHAPPRMSPPIEEACREVWQNLQSLRSPGLDESTSLL